MIPSHPNAIALPELRDDLQIVRRDVSLLGAPVWILLDPLRNKFFTISYELFQLLSLWNANLNSLQLAISVSQRYGREPSAKEINEALYLLKDCDLLTASGPDDWRELHKKATAHSWYSTVIHSYLFFRLPLAHPEPFIRAIWPYVSFLCSKGALVSVALIGMLGLYLVSRQWDTFIGTFSYVFTLEGALASLIAVAFVKSCHEAGHALVAHRFGCRIPTVGLAFMVMVPRLYTDVTEAWKIRSRRSRLLVDAAGVMAELYVAALALLIWVFLPEGPIRSAVFVLASTSWVLSVLINLNPVIRFDGYYILCDLLGIDNLQPRAFAHFRWRLRRLLFGIDDEPPEFFSSQTSLILILYAIITIIYRLTLYVGIALVVYHFFIKILGIVLFLIEVFYFILLPIFREALTWWHDRQEIMKKRRTYVSLAIFLVPVIGICIPLSTTVRVPAVMTPSLYTHIYAGEAGRIMGLELQSGQPIEKGAVLARINSPDLEKDLKLTILQLNLTERKLSQIGADPKLLSQRGVLLSQREKLSSGLRGLDERKANLTLTAPFPIRLVDVDPAIQNGRWVGKGDEIALLVSDDSRIVRGYAGEDDFARVDAGATGTFVPADISRRSVRVAVSRVSTAAIDRVDIAQLSSVHGGPIAVNPNREGELIPQSAQHAITAIPTEPTEDYLQYAPGTMLLEGKPESIVARVWRQVLRVLVRETSV